MQPISAIAPYASTPTPPAAPAAPAAPVAAAPRAGGGSQGLVADVLRGAGAGYAAATNSASVTADKGMIYPIESIYQGVSLIASKTKDVPVLGKVTKFLPTIAGFGLLIVGMNASSMLKAPGETAMDLTHGLADMLDGRQTRSGWSLGFGVDTGEGEDATAAPVSGIGSTLASLGVAGAPQG